MYNKLFTKILDSSVWLESNPTRIVWIMMIAAMDEHGFVSMASSHNVARRANVSLEEAEKAITVLESPDTIQPNQDSEGRRLERVEGGWMVLNSEKYRSMVTRAESLHKNRERVAKFRARKRGGNAPVMACNDLVMQSEHKQIRSESDPKPRSPAAPVGLAFESTAFKEAWGDFEAHRLEIRKKLTPTSVKQAMAQMKSMGEPRAVAMIRHTIFKGWQGLKEDDAPRANGVERVEYQEPSNLRHD